MSKRKLLLADDSVTIQKVVNLTFADEGIDVISVGDGNSAMEKFVESTPDLVMVDVNMPGLDGYRICEMIKQDEETKHVPVILLVGSFEPFDENEARRVGANDYLTKPFQSIRQLVNKVTVLLNRTNGQSAQTSEPSAVSQPEPIPHAVDESFVPLGDAGMDDDMIQASQIGSLPVSDFSKLGASEQTAETQAEEESDPNRTQSYTAEEIRQFTPETSTEAEAVPDEAERSTALDEQMLSQFENEIAEPESDITAGYKFDERESAAEQDLNDSDADETGFEFVNEEQVIYSDQTSASFEQYDPQALEPEKAVEPELVEESPEMFAPEPVSFDASEQYSEPVEETSSEIEPDEIEEPFKADTIQYSPEEYFDFRRSENQQPNEPVIEENVEDSSFSNLADSYSPPVLVEDQPNGAVEDDSERFSDSFGQLPEEYVFDSFNEEKATETEPAINEAASVEEEPAPDESFPVEHEPEAESAETPQYFAEEKTEDFEMPKAVYHTEVNEAATAEIISEPESIPASEDEPEPAEEEQPKPSEEFNALVSGKAKNEAVENVIVSEFARHSITLSSEAVETIAARIADKISEKIVQQLAADVVTDLADLIVDRMEQRKLE
ncbi:MAG: response regulator [Pyrinomonadaceae bacterium]|nr:response regulator [Pyrinomonadaceae bacterium]